MTIKTDKPIQVGVEDDTPPGGAGSPHSGGSGGGRYRGGGGTLGGHGAPVGGGGGPAGPSVDGKAPAPYRGYQGRPASVPADAATMGREIKRVADNLGIDPVDLATVISYETIGTMSTSITGGKGNRYQGLIQFGGPERKMYGAYKGQPFPDQMDAVERYLKHRGLKPGMGLEDLYSTINAGSPGHGNRSDRPGYTVARHAREMARSAHRDRAERIIAAGAPQHKGEPPSPSQPQPVYPEGSPLRQDKPSALYLPLTVDRWKTKTMTYAADKHGSRNSLRRVTVMEVDDSKPQQTLYVKGMYEEEIKGAYRQQGFGVSSMPPVGSEGLAFTVAGRPDQILFLESEHKDHRPTNQEGGSNVLYDANGNKITMNGEGNTHDASKHTFNGPVEINGDVTINGNITQEGDFSQDGVHTDDNGTHS